MNRNFDPRRATVQLSPGNLAMIDSARSIGSSPKFTGAGATIVGTFLLRNARIPIRPSAQGTGKDSFEINR
jgi:hypothetical protein